MGVLQSLYKTLVRLRYPVSLPQDIAHAIGIDLPNSVRFSELLAALTCDRLTICQLEKFMSRREAERAFKNALRKEHFHSSSLFSFYFSEGWLEFELHFDDLSRLRRIYIHHKLLSCPSGFELPLQSAGLHQRVPSAA